MIGSAVAGSSALSCCRNRCCTSRLPKLLWVWTSSYNVRLRPPTGSEARSKCSDWSSFRSLQSMTISGSATPVSSIRANAV
jgi:hypothetical protein